MRQMVELSDKYLRLSIITMFNEVMVNILRSEKINSISGKSKTQKELNGNFRTKQYNIWNLKRNNNWMGWMADCRQRQQRKEFKFKEQ